MARRKGKDNVIHYLIYPIMLLIGLCIGYGAKREADYAEQLDEKADHQAPSDRKKTPCATKWNYTIGGTVTPYFSPTKKKALREDKGITNMMVQVINNTNTTLRIGIFSLTPGPIFNALKAAAKRGVDVGIIIDKKFAGKNSSMNELAAAGIHIYVYRGGHTYHNKYLVSDGKILTTGSFNFSKSAENTNREDCCHIEGVAPLARDYEGQWRKERDHPKVKRLGEGGNRRT
jgi:phosphatidylserine/phosphatidylglycerophosphate/cardiolipin synthase-like enzyme